MFVTNKTRLYSRPPQRLIPVIDPTGSNEHLFLMEFDGKTLVNEIRDCNNLTIETAPIRTGVKFDLLRNSNANLLIQTGNLHVTETIDPVAYLRQVFITINGELFSVMVHENTTARAQPTFFGDSHGLEFKGSLSYIGFDKETKNYFGEVPYWNPMLVNETHSAFNVVLSVTGKISTGLGPTEINIEPVGFAQIGVGHKDLSKFMKHLQDSVKVVAYTLDTHFTHTTKVNY